MQAFAGSIENDAMWERGCCQGRWSQARIRARMVCGKCYRVSEVRFGSSVRWSSRLAVGILGCERSFVLLQTGVERGKVHSIETTYGSWSTDQF